MGVVTVVQVHVTQRFFWVHLRPNMVFLPSVGVSKNDDKYAALDSDVHDALDASVS